MTNVLSEKKIVDKGLGQLFTYYFQVFNSYSGQKLGLLCGIIFLGGLLEGLGISLLLPILNFQSPAMANDPYIQTIHRLYARLGIPISLQAILLLLVIVFFCKGLLIFAQEVMKAYLLTDLTKIKREEVCRRYAEMGYLHYIEKSIGFLNNIITTEIDRAVSGFGQYTELIVTSIYILIYTVAAYLINWRVTLLVIGLCAVLFILSETLSRVARELSIKVSEKNAQIQSLLIQMIYNFKYLKATHRFSALYKQFSKRVEEHRSFQFQNSALSAISPSMLEPVVVLLLSALIFYYVSYQGKPIGEIVVLLLFFYRSFSKVFGLQIAWQKFCARAGGVDVLEQMTVELREHKEKQGAYIPEELQHAVTFKNVDYSYGFHPILSNVTIQIPANKTIAIVGESGAGKTTVLDMIVGLILPQHGAIFLDDKDYQDLDLSALRSQIGYVTQEPVIFNDTIANNVSFWAEGIPPDELNKKIEAAAKLAHCVEFIQKTEKGYDSVIGDKGVKLSVGQRQRIAIAREIFKDPAIMIFDEATSALDSESERLIQESIQAIMGTRTMIIVAHRLSTIKQCDYIYVLDEGKVIEEGNFEALLAHHDSRFARMCEAQKL